MKKFALCLAHYFPHGGQQRDMLALAHVLQQHGHEVHIYCMQWRGSKPSWLQLHLLPNKARTNHRKIERFNYDLLKTVKQENFDSIIGFIKLKGLDYYFAADRCFKNKQGFWKRFLTRYHIFNLLEHAVFANTSNTHIFCLTEQQKHDYQTVYATPDNRFTILPPALPQNTKQLLKNRRPAQQLREKLKLDSNTFLCMSVASNFKRKGVDRNLLAIKHLTQKGFKIHFLVIGADKIQAYSQLAQAHELQHHVTFLGGKDESTPYLLAADLMLHPARSEAGGIVLLEAICAGLPIITTDICGYAPVVKAAHAGKVLMSPFHQKDYEKAMEKMLNHAVLKHYQENCHDYSDKLIEGGATLAMATILMQDDRINR